MREVITLQVGHYPNFVGSHLWNIRVSCCAVGVSMCACILVVQWGWIHMHTPTEGDHRRCHPRCCDLAPPHPSSAPIFIPHHLPFVLAADIVFVCLFVCLFVWGGAQDAALQQVAFDVSRCSVNYETFFRAGETRSVCHTYSRIFSRAPSRLAVDVYFSCCVCVCVCVCMFVFM